MFHVFLADGDMKSFTYDQQTTVAVSKAHVTSATFTFLLYKQVRQEVGLHITNTDDYSYYE